MKCFFSNLHDGQIRTSFLELLLKPDPVMLQIYVCQSKHDDLVNEVQFTGVNPMYAHLKFPSGRKAKFSLCDLFT